MGTGGSEEPRASRPSCGAGGEEELSVLLGTLYPAWAGVVLGKAATVSLLHGLFPQLLLPAASFPGLLQQGPNLLLLHCHAPGTAPHTPGGCKRPEQEALTASWKYWVLKASPFSLKSLNLLLCFI